MDWSLSQEQKQQRLEAALRDGAAARASGDAAAYAVAAIAAARAVSFGARPAAGDMPAALELLLSLVFSDSDEAVCLASDAMRTCLRTQFVAHNYTADPTLDFSRLFSVNVLQRLAQLAQHASRRAASAALNLLHYTFLYLGEADKKFNASPDRDGLSQGHCSRAGQCR